MKKPIPEDQIESFTARFEDNSALKGREKAFITVDALVAPVLASWKESLFAHEWLHPDGSIKKPSEMTEKMALRRQGVEDRLGSEQALERPVLGIGILDNIEIGAGRDLFLALAARGIDKIPVHIPQSHLDDFRFFVRNPE